MMRIALIASLALCAAQLPAQRPANEAAALRALEQLSDGPERLRHRAARELGSFDGQAATDALLAQLATAKSPSYLATVVRALGRRARQGAVAPLMAKFRSLEAPRLCEAVAEALRRQGPDGIQALAGELEPMRQRRAHRQALCYSLGKVQRGDAARDALLEELRVAGPGQQLQPLQGLAARRDDPVVDAARLRLAESSNLLVAGAAVQQLADDEHGSAADAALALARRLGPEDRGDLHRAVLAGLLFAHAARGDEALWRAAARADKAFGEDLTERWQQALGDPRFFDALATRAAKSKDAASRAAIARALALVGADQRTAAIELLSTLLADRELWVVQAACVSAEELGADSRGALGATLGAGAPAHQAARIAALMAMPVLEDPAAAQLAELQPKLKAEALAAWLQGLAKGGHAPLPACAEVARRHLASRDWRVRAAALQLALKAPDKPLVAALIDRLKREEGRMEQDVRAALQRITGARFGAAKDWQRWWRKAQKDAELPLAAAPKGGGDVREGTASYWGLSIHSTRVAFLVDTSGSMREPFGTGDGTRLDEAEHQLQNVLSKLPKGAQANVVTFAARPTQMFPELQKLSGRRKKDAASFLAALESKGPTNLYSGLRSVFGDPGVDTVVVLSDGRPSAGWETAPDGLLELARVWNAGRMVRIHTVALGAPSELLEKLAQATGGEHRVAR